MLLTIASSPLVNLHTVKLKLFSEYKLTTYVTLKLAAKNDTFWPLDGTSGQASVLTHLSKPNFPLSFPASAPAPAPAPAPVLAPDSDSAPVKTPVPIDLHDFSPSVQHTMK